MDEATVKLLAQFGYGPTQKQPTPGKAKLLSNPHSGEGPTRTLPVSPNSLIDQFLKGAKAESAAEDALIKGAKTRIELQALAKQLLPFFIACGGTNAPSKMIRLSSTLQTKRGRVPLCIVPNGDFIEKVVTSKKLTTIGIAACDVPAQLINTTLEILPAEWRHLDLDVVKKEIEALVESYKQDIDSVELENCEPRVRPAQLQITEATEKKDPPPAPKNPGSEGYL